MKRIVWLLLIAFSTAVAQVETVDLGVRPSDACGCCEQPGACGMPACAPAPVAVQVALDLPAGTQATLHGSQPAGPAAEAQKFYARFAPVPPVAPIRTMCRIPLVARAPLFEAHCSLLL